MTHTVAGETGCACPQPYLLLADAAGGRVGIYGARRKPQRWSRCQAATWMVPVKFSRIERAFFPPSHLPALLVLTASFFLLYRIILQAQLNHVGNAETQRHNLPASAGCGEDEPAHPNQVARPTISRLPARRGLLGARDPSRSWSVALLAAPSPSCQS